MSHTHYCVVGDVAVDAAAAIAPGVVLQALPGSRIVIGSGACLAGGVCVQAKVGLLTISAGATLGANVLVVGSGKIGANACVSPGSTLINPQVEDNALLPPNTLSGAPPQKASTATASSYVSSSSSGSSASQNSFNQGSSNQSSFNQNNSSKSGFNQSSFDRSSFNQGSSQNDFSQNSPRQNSFNQHQNSFNQAGSSQNSFGQSGPAQNISTQDLPKNTFIEPGPIEPKPIQIPSINVSGPAATFDPSRNGVQLNQKFELSSDSQSSALTAPSHDKVYGRDQVSDLISTLFPNRQSLNGN